METVLRIYQWIFVADNDLSMLERVILAPFILILLFDNNL